MAAFLTTASDGRSELVWVGAKAQVYNRAARGRHRRQT